MKHMKDLGCQDGSVSGPFSRPFLVRILSSRGLISDSMLWFKKKASRVTNEGKKSC